MKTQSFSDIMFSIPSYDDDRDSWYQEHIWFTGTEKRQRYTICDSDGNHEPIGKREVNKLEKEHEQLWLNYSKWVIKHNGEDPIGEFFVKTSKTIKRNYVAYFQHWIGEDKHGLALKSVRWSGGLLRPDELPKGFQEFLCIKKIGDRYCMDGITEKELKEAPDIGYVGNGYFKGKAEWKEPIPEETIRRDTIRIAKRHIKRKAA